VERRLRASGHEVAQVHTRAPGHATELAEHLVRTGIERLVVAGGDGTVCEAAEGVHRAGRGELAVLPLGTGNDAARTLGIPLDLPSAASAAARGRARPVDLIRVGDRCIVNAIGVGLTADINHRAARVKWMRGIGVYLATAAVSLFRYRAPSVTVRVGDRSVDSTMAILAVHNGPTTGGGFRLTPDAVPDDGLLDATLVPDIPVAGRLRRLVAALRGTLHTSDGSVVFRGPVLELYHDDALEVHLDGNQWRLEPPVTRFEIVPKALMVVVPGE
jgi:diacylglycerol kinase (ATP)